MASSTHTQAEAPEAIVVGAPIALALLAIVAGLLLLAL